MLSIHTPNINSLAVFFFQTNHGQVYKDKMKELQSQPHMSGKMQKTLDYIVSQGAQSRVGPKIEHYARQL